MESGRTDSNRKYYERLLRQAKEEGEKQAAQEQDSLLSEDPLGVNYARWATEEEIQASLTEILPGQDQTERSGVPLLCKDGVTYVDSSDSHSLIIGASGSKKTRLFILPSILSLSKAGESMIITDPKAELYERTSGLLREKGYRIFCINFRDDSRQNCWNPLDAPRQFFQNGKFDLAVGLLNDFSTIAVPKDQRGSDPFWDDSARSSFMGMLLLMFLLAEKKEEINIRGLLRMRNTLFQPLSDKDKTPRFKKLFSLLDPGSLVASYLSVLAIAPERTLGSILATLDTHLIKFIMRPDLTDMLCHNDIDFHSLGHEKTAIFLVMPDEKETYHGLVSIFVQQCYESLIFEAQKLPGKTLPRRVNFLLDEFSSLPPIKEFPAMIAAARSRNIRFNIVIQSEKQLRSRYQEEADTIKGNCNNWIFLYSRELQTLEELSRLCGSQKSGNPLVTPSRLQRLNKEAGEVLVIHGRDYPFLSHLDDISQYDHDQILPPCYQRTEEGPIQVFQVDELMRRHSEEWLSARLAQNTVKQAEAEVNEQAAEEEKRLSEERIAVLQRMKAVSWLPVQTGDLSGNSILEASRSWYAKAFPTDAPLPALASHQCSFLDLAKLSAKGKKQPAEAPAQVILPESPFPLNYISVGMELNRESMALVSEDAEILAAAAHHMYRRALAGGQVIPIFFEMKNLLPDWNPITMRKGSPTLLSLMLARQLFGGEMPKMPEAPEDGDWKKTQLPPIEDPLLSNAKMLYQEFKQQPESMPKYLLILHLLEQAPMRVDAIWQAWDMAELPNVRLVVTTTQASMLTKNCVEYINPKASFPNGSPTILYFDEACDEVKVRQGSSPRICLEVTKCSPS